MSTSNYRPFTYANPGNIQVLSRKPEGAKPRAKKRVLYLFLASVTLANAVTAHSYFENFSACGVSLNPANPVVAAEASAPLPLSLDKPSLQQDDPPSLSISSPPDKRLALGTGKQQRHDQPPSGTQPPQNNAKALAKLILAEKLEKLEASLETVTLQESDSENTLEISVSQPDVPNAAPLEPHPDFSIKPLIIVAENLSRKEQSKTADDPIEFESKGIAKTNLIEKLTKLNRAGLIDITADVGYGNLVEARGDGIDQRQAIVPVPKLKPNPSAVSQVAEAENNANEPSRALAYLPQKGPVLQKGDGSRGIWRLFSNLDQPVSTDPSVSTKPVANHVPIPSSKPAPSAEQQIAAAQASPVNAYANQNNGALEDREPFSGFKWLFSGPQAALPPRSERIAVYDVSAATVYMPDGSKLEAHSGLGDLMDKPEHAHVKNMGPTPPNIYDLRMREALYHGVEAIRMLPRDRGAMKGRDGFLAHTPLLKNSPGSHGCVSFKNYDMFLKAFKAGRVQKLIVVPSMKRLPTYLAKLGTPSSS